MRQFIILVLAAFLLTEVLGDAKRSLGRGSSSRSSSSSSSRRTSSHVTSRPSSSHSVTSRPSPSYNSHADASKLSYPNYNSQPNRPAAQPASNIGWNTNQNKPVGPPPVYSPHNPAGGARPNINEKPPSYTGVGNTPIRAATQRPLQSSYPKQPLPANSYPHNSALPPNAGPPKYYPVGSAPNVGYHPAGTMGAGYHPPAGPTYFPSGHAPPVGYHPGGYGGGGFHPQSPPVYAPPGAVQPGFYPAGSFPQQNTNTGPGLGTGLIAGAIGGAVLGHVLTPSHSGSSSSNNNGGHSDSDRVIIINNTPGQPSTVATQDGHQPVVINNSQPQAAHPEAPVPLAPFQPGSTQVANQPPSGPTDQMASAGAVSPPLVHSPNSAAPGQTYPEGAVPLAPLGENNSSSTEAPKSGGMMCYPVLVNVTSETDPTNITTVEQIACYEVPVGFDPNAAQQSTTGSTTGTTMSQQPDLMHMPGEQITQRTSTATVAESSQIKQNGALGQHSPWSTITSTIAAFVIAYCLQ